MIGAPDEQPGTDVERRLHEQQAREREQQRQRELQAHRDREQELLDEEERARLEAEAQANVGQVPGAAGSSASRRGTFLGRLGLGKKPSPDAADDDATEDDPDDFAVPANKADGGGSPLLWCIVLALMAGGAYVGYRFMASSKDSHAPVVAAVKDKDPSGLPLALPGEGLSAPQGPASATAQVDNLGTASSAEPVQPVASAVRPASAATSGRLPDPESTGVKPAATADAKDPLVGQVQPETADAGAAPSRLDKNIVADDATLLTERLSLSEIRITNLQAAMERLEQRLAAYEHGNAPAVRKPSVPARVKPTRPARVAPVSLSVANAPVTAPAPQLQAQLLSVDVWDGQPSVVVGTNAPGDARTRVLQIGDQLNGVTLQSVDVSQRKATFGTGAGSVTMDMTQGQRP